MSRYVAKTLSFIPHTSTREVLSSLPLHRLMSINLNPRTTEVPWFARVTLLIRGVVKVSSFRPAFFPPLLLREQEPSGRWPRLKCRLPGGLQPTVTSPVSHKGPLARSAPHTLLPPCLDSPSPRTHDLQAPPFEGWEPAAPLPWAPPCCVQSRCACKRPGKHSRTLVSIPHRSLRAKDAHSPQQRVKVPPQ